MTESLELSDEALLAFVDFLRLNNIRDPAMIRRVFAAYVRGDHKDYP